MILDRHPAYPEVNQELRYIGFWRTMDRRCTTDARPHPGDYVDESWDPAERERVAAYLEQGRVLYSWLGSSTCRLCGLRPNGRECLTDGVWCWPSGLAHTVREHSVRPPDEFLVHVLRRDVLRDP